MCIQSVSVSPLLIEALQCLDVEAWPYVAKLTQRTFDILKSQVDLFLSDVDAVDPQRARQLKKYVSQHVGRYVLWTEMNVSRDSKQVRPDLPPHKIEKMVHHSAGLRDSIKNFVHGKNNHLFAH